MALLRRRSVPVVALVPLLFWLGLAAAPATGAAEPLVAPNLGEARSYPGADFVGLPDGWPTEYETQNKLWFHDGAWWALMLTSAGALAVHELEPDHTWRAASEPLSTEPMGVGDVLAGPDEVNVMFTRAQGLTFARLGYDSSARNYVFGAPRIVAVSSEGGRTGSIDVDSTGRLWIAFGTRNEVLVTSSADGGLTWSTPAAPPVPGTDVADGEVAGVVAFDDSIGVMWSDQQRSRFSFAVRSDTAPLDEWTLEVPLSGEAMADDHINLKVASGPGGDTVLASVKTSQDDLVGVSPEAPLMLVLARSPAGKWVSHVAGTIADKQNRPSLIVDEANQAVHFLSHAPASGGSVYIKSASLSELSFPPGRGDVLVEGPGRIADVTTPDHIVTSTSGLVVLASSRDLKAYHHAELALLTPDGLPPTPPEDGRAPPAPQDVLSTPSAEGSVALFWSESVDAGQWVPAVEGVPAAEYVVLRDGTPVGTVDDLSFVDRPGPGSFEYTVLALDEAGNHSVPSEATAIELETSATGSIASWWYLALGAVGLVGAVAAVRKLAGGL